MPDIVAIIGAITGAIGLYVAWHTSRASARKDEVEALCQIIDALRERVDELEAEVAKWKARHDNLLARHNRLRQWAIAQGLDPNSRLTTGQLTMPEHSQGGGG